MLAFVPWLVDMRVSEDSYFADSAAGDVSWREFSAIVPFTLSDQDGLHTIYAQFRDVEGVESQVFSTAGILDRT